MDAWPSEGLEKVAACPACRTSERSSLYRDLTDRVFGVAPGIWTLYSCCGCGAAYLDPRPTRESIGLAYRDYSTAHMSEDADALHTRHSAFGRVRAALHNGYINARYGYSLTPAIRAGRFLLPLFPRRREAADMSLRHLPKRTALLDAGCGNGEFALRMAGFGWQARGLEPDPVASAIARAAGLPVLNTPLEEAALPPRHFDAITLSHVIEHLHDPAAALQKCNWALGTDGLLWIATPNLDSLGHRTFGSDWLHLDPPRHLTLFDRQALERLLLQSGFRPLEWFSRRSAEFSFANSAALAQGMRPFTESEMPARLRFRARAADALALVARQFGEELVVLARRV